MGLFAGSIFLKESILLYYLWFNQSQRKLPKYRGGNPLNWQILNDKNFLEYLIKINKELGDIYLKKNLDY